MKDNKKKPTDWYLKWVASCFIILAICFRSVQEFPEIDLILSFIGCFMWTLVGLISVEERADDIEFLIEKGSE